MTGSSTPCATSRDTGSFRRTSAAKPTGTPLFPSAEPGVDPAILPYVLEVQLPYHAPPLETPVLGGIVREAVLELCGALGIGRHDDRPLTIHETLAAEEMFLTASCSGVRPVIRIEHHGVGDEKPGPITRKIMDAYRELLDRECAS